MSGLHFIIPDRMSQVTPPNSNVRTIPLTSLHCCFNSLKRTKNLVSGWTDVNGFPSISDIFFMENTAGMKSWVKYGVRSTKFIWAPVYSCTHWLRPRNPPPPLPPHLGSYARALLVSQDRRHLFLNPWMKWFTCRRVMRRAAILILSMAVLPAALGQRGNIYIFA
jgi:hypothetical protein